MPKIVSLQVLRGIAASLVVGFHLYGASIAEGGTPGLFTLFSGGRIGVDIFFVISGFIIYFVVHNRADMTRRNFFWARFLRIVPTYWAILVLYILAGTAMWVFFKDPSKLPTIQSLMSSVFLLPTPHQIIEVAWTLSLEMMFYLIFGLFYFWGGVRPLVGALLAWVLATQFFKYGVEHKPELLTLPLHSVVAEFLFGVLIAVILTSRPTLPKRLAVPFLILGGASVAAYSVVGGFDTNLLGREITAGIPAALLVFGAVGFSMKPAPRVELWGESSYILYLIHLLYFSTLAVVIEKGLGTNIYHSQIWMVFTFVSVLAVSYAATLFIEKPYQRWYRARLARAG